MYPPIIGIDFGTTNSALGVYIDGALKMIPPDPENPNVLTLPSIINIDKNHMPHFGLNAKRRQEEDPENTLTAIKRHLGTNKTFTLAQKTYTPEEISAMILCFLKRQAERVLGTPIEKAIITVPAYFSEKQRQATLNAAKLAELDIVRMVNEPTAAAMAYASRTLEAKKVLIYDLGGGTFDVSVLNIESHVVEVIASHGNTHLGGEDFDAKLLQMIMGSLNDFQYQAFSRDTHAFYTLKKLATDAKIGLSSSPYFTIDHKDLATRKNRPVHLELEINRHQFIEKIDPLLNETFQVVHDTLLKAKLSPKQIDEIILVGGSTRIPEITNRLYNIFQKAPRCEIDPDLCVAQGAALIGAKHAGQNIANTLIDVTPYTFGTSYVGELNNTPYSEVYKHIIEKNTPLPVEKSEVFYTTIENQKNVNVKIYQGEDPDALNNLLIGEFKIEGLENSPVHSPIIVTLSLDINGILTVAAKEKNSDKNKTIVIENAFANIPFEPKTVKPKLQKTKTHEKIPQNLTWVTPPHSSGNQKSEPRPHPKIDIASLLPLPKETLLEAEGLIARAEEIQSELDETDQNDLDILITDLQNSLEHNDIQKQKAAQQALSDVLFLLEKAMT